MTQCANCTREVAAVLHSQVNAGFVLNEHLCADCQRDVNTLRLVLVKNAATGWSIESVQPLRQTFAAPTEPSFG